MKTLLSKFVLFFSFFLISLSMLANNPVDTGGNWGKKGPRSLLPTTPAEPVAYINTNVLSIYFTDTIADLYVCVTDSDNNIVYAGYISAPTGNYTYDNIVLTLVVGETYTLEMSHDAYGYLTGTFVY